MNFQPFQFVKNLSYMGIGWATIFIIIAIIILVTVAVNKIFADKKK